LLGSTTAAARPKSANQVRAIFAEGRRRGLDHEALGDMAESVTRRTRHLSELTHTEAEALLRKLKGQGFVPLRTLQYRRRKQGIEQLVQQSQLDLIAALASQREWSAETLLKFCKRQCGHTTPRTTRQANKVIEGLKAMNLRSGLWAN